MIGHLPLRRPGPDKLLRLALHAVDLQRTGFSAAGHPAAAADNDENDAAAAAAAAADDDDNDDDDDWP